MSDEYDLDDPADLDEWFEHLGELVLQDEPESYDRFRDAVAAMTDETRRQVARSLIWHQEVYNQRQWS
jgi:hypothetical protein